MKNLDRKGRRSGSTDDSDASTPENNADSEENKSSKKKLSLKTEKPKLEDYMGNESGGGMHENFRYCTGLCCHREKI